MRFEPIDIAIKRLPHGEGLDLPRYETAGAAGMDVSAAEDATLAPGARALIAIADPRFREDLERSARESGLLD